MDAMPMNNTRNSNMELLRIVAMYMIVTVHACMYYGVFCSGNGASIYKGAVNGICNIGVTLFILISGYYGVTCNVRKLVRMECMMITYSLLETAILYVFLPGELQGTALLEQLVKSLLPFITRKYWFYSCYVSLVLLSGYMQRFLETLEQRSLERLLALLLVLFSVFPTLFYFEIIPDNGKGLVQMIMVYMIGRYIRMYRDVRLPRKALILFLVLWILSGISHEHPIVIGDMIHRLCKDNSITSICMAVILFYIFKEWQFSCRVVNVVAGHIFAVFALNNTLTRIVMERIQASGFVSPDGLAGFCLFLGTALCILAGCVAVGAVRSALLRTPDERIAAAVEQSWNRIEARIMRDD